MVEMETLLAYCFAALSSSGGLSTGIVVMVVCSSLGCSASICFLLDFEVGDAANLPDLGGSLEDDAIRMVLPARFDGETLPSTRMVEMGSPDLLLLSNLVLGITTDL
ncbi:hypothetical protein ACLOJK_041031 [Asimina triloba]